jgi:hypothetical protein
MTLYILVFVTYTHAWINGQNTFVKVCYYSKQNATYYERQYKKKRYVVDPDTYCPPFFKLTMS